MFYDVQRPNFQEFKFENSFINYSRFQRFESVRSVVNLFKNSYVLG